MRVLGLLCLSVALFSFGCQKGGGGGGSTQQDLKEYYKQFTYDGTSTKVLKSNVFRLPDQKKLLNLAEEPKRIESAQVAKVTIVLNSNERFVLDYQEGLGNSVIQLSDADKKYYDSSDIKPGASNEVRIEGTWEIVDGILKLGNVADGFRASFEGKNSITLKFHRNVLSEGLTTAEINLTADTTAPEVLPTSMESYFETYTHRPNQEGKSKYFILNPVVIVEDSDETKQICANASIFLLSDGQYKAKYTEFNCELRNGYKDSAPKIVKKIEGKWSIVEGKLVLTGLGSGVPSITHQNRVRFQFDTDIETAGLSGLVTLGRQSHSEIEMSKIY